MATKKQTTARAPRASTPQPPEAAAPLKTSGLEAKGETDVARLVADLSAQVTALTERLARLEAPAATAAPAPAPAAQAKPAPVAKPEPKAAPEISDEEILAVSAALAAYFGVRMRIRQIRLLSSQAWAQQGRVSIQASHRLHN